MNFLNNEIFERGIGIAEKKLGTRRNENVN